MDLILLLVLPAVLWVQSWHYLGFYSSSRTLGLTAATVAVVLLAVVLFQDKLQLVIGIDGPTDLLLTASTPMSIFVLMWAIYSALVAGVYLWGFDARTLGFYSLFLWLVSALFAVYFFVGDRLLDGEAIAFTWLMGVVSILLAVMAALLFFYLALLPQGQSEPPSSPLRTATGWVYLIFSVVVVVLGGLLLLGLNPLL